MSKNKPSYEVGYKRPPAAHRFKPGESGNPAGRPKGRKSFQSLVQDAADTQIQVTMAGRKTSMTMAQAFVQSLFKTALSGDAKVYPLVIELLQRYLDDDSAAIADDDRRAAERALVAQYLQAHSGRGDDSSNG